MGLLGLATAAPQAMADELWKAGTPGTNYGGMQELVRGYNPLQTKPDSLEERVRKAAMHKQWLEEQIVSWKKIANGAYLDKEVSQWYEHGQEKRRKQYVKSLKSLSPAGRQMILENIAVEEYKKNYFERAVNQVKELARQLTGLSLGKNYPDWADQPQQAESAGGGSYPS